MRQACRSVTMSPLVCDRTNSRHVLHSSSELRDFRSGSDTRGALARRTFAIEKVCGMVGVLLSRRRAGYAAAGQIRP